MYLHELCSSTSRNNNWLYYNTRVLGHEDKPHIVKYHPLASGVLASSALDLTVKIWDINKAKDVITLTDHTRQVR